jgi:hypothetical protein
VIWHLKGKTENESTQIMKWFEFAGGIKATRHEQTGIK